MIYDLRSISYGLVSLKVDLLSKIRPKPGTLYLHYSFQLEINLRIINSNSNNNHKNNKIIVANNIIKFCDKSMNFNFFEFQIFPIQSIRKPNNTRIL